MKGTGDFITTLDLGVLGEHDVAVKWEGYRPETQALDDFPEMSITRIGIDIGGVILDITDMIILPMLEDLRVMAWEKFPTKDEAREERASAGYEHWKNAREEARLGER